MLSSCLCVYLCVVYARKCWKVKIDLSIKQAKTDLSINQAKTDLSIKQALLIIAKNPIY